jgi:hypothetical protein
MNSFWKVAAPVTCMVAICVAVILWQFYKHKGNETKLAEDARTARASAEHGDAKAETGLGSMYYYGEGVSRDRGAPLVSQSRRPGCGAGSIRCRSYV